MKKSLFRFILTNCILLLLSFSIKVNGQTFYNQSPAYIKANSVWPFIGDGTGLDFNTSPPTVVSTYNIGWTGEGQASVADPVTGQLLFYSDGERCWNANNVVMQNGDSLLGNSMALSGLAIGFPYGSGGSTNQGVCIVPFVNQAGKYYLFSLNGPTTWGVGVAPTTYCLYYSVIDRSLDGGLGGIVPGQKNIPLNSMNKLLSECMIAVPGNNCDVWLVVHDYLDPVFRSYHITTQGVDTNAVVSLTGSQIQGAGGFGAYYLGCMGISPDRGYLAITSYNGGGIPGLAAMGALLCKFDPATGTVSNALKYGNSAFNPCGVAFSPDNSKLYTTHTVNGSNQISQFDISSFNAATITASQQLIGNFNSYTGLPNLKLYNGKIYEGSSGDFVNVVNAPNLPAAAADFVNADPMLPIGFNFLPNDVVFALPPDTAFTRRDTVVCVRNGVYENLSVLAPAGFYGYLWDDGSQGTSRNITADGAYWVLCKDSCHSVTDTIVVHAIDIPLDLGNDTVLCNGASLVWDITYAGSSYLWQDNSTRGNYTARDSGTYWVQATFNSCVVRDTVRLNTINVKQDLGADIVICKGEKLTAPVQVYANVPSGAGALWSNGSNNNSIGVTDTGNYWVTVTATGCTGSDTISVMEEHCNCSAGIPNAFSPNGDGHNDIFQPLIEYGCPVKSYILSIYNRYGARVFAGYNPDKGWDGMYSNGKYADAGTYMFELSFTGGTHQNKYYKKGDLILVR